MNYVTGNIITMGLNKEFDILVHGCNCFNTMGSGLANQIKKHFEGAYTIDQSTSRGDRNKLGTYTYAVYNPIIVNAYTQYDYGTDGKDRFEYEAFSLILDKLKFQWSNKHFGFPLIGCGLAGGNESKIVTMIQEFDRKISFYGGKVTLVRF